MKLEKKVRTSQHLKSGRREKAALGSEKGWSEQERSLSKKQE